MEDPALIASMATGEEEPGEGESEESPEELLAFPETRCIPFTSRAPAKGLPLIPQAKRFQIVREVVLPPPEAALLPEPDQQQVFQL